MVLSKQLALKFTKFFFRASAIDFISLVRARARAPDFQARADIGCLMKNAIPGGPSDIGCLMKTANLKIKFSAPSAAGKP